MTASTGALVWRLHDMRSGGRVCRQFVSVIDISVINKKSMTSYDTYIVGATNGGRNFSMAHPPTFVVIAILTETPAETLTI